MKDYQVRESWIKVKLLTLPWVGTYDYRGPFCFIAPSTVLLNVGENEFMECECATSGMTLSGDI